MYSRIKINYQTILFVRAYVCVGCMWVVTCMSVCILDSLIVFIEQIRPLTKRSNLYKILDSRVTFECRRNSEPH